MIPRSSRPVNGAPPPRIVQRKKTYACPPAWQAKLREAEADLDAGRVRRFDSDEDFLNHLEAIDDEAG
jgi:hypothetical protein